MFEPRWKKVLSVGLVVFVLVVLVLVGVIGYRLLEYRRRSPVREGISALKAGDYQRALTNLTPFAKAGDPLAQEMLGDMHAFGLGVPVDEIQARIWFRRAECEHGVPGRSEYGAALEYLEGHAVGRDKTAAIKWIQHAAEAGHPEAQRLLADSDKLAAKGLTVDSSISTYWRQVIKKP